jgi:hypothetical protein
VLDAKPKWEIIGLKGRYRFDCCRSLRDFKRQKYSIVAMCHEDLHEFLKNGDMDRVYRIVKEKEHEGQRT